MRFCKLTLLVGVLAIVVGCTSSEPPPNPDLPKEVNVPPAPKGGSKMNVIQEQGKK